MTDKIAIIRGLRATFLAVAVVLVVAGCGTKASSSASTPSPTASQSSLAVQLAAVTGYLGEVKPIAVQVEATVTSLPSAVNGLSKKPDSTWTTSATKLKAISSQLGTEATNLAALAPPGVLRPVQDAAVKGIKDAQTAVAKTAETLDKRVAKQGATAAKVRSQISALKDRLSQLGQQLLTAIQSAIASPNSTPAP